MLPPLMSTINDQTGISLPEWAFGKLAHQISDTEVNGTDISSAIKTTTVAKAK